MHARDLRLLFLFAEIVRAGSIRGAASALSLSPPVVSAALRDLEALIGTTLIRRTTRKLALTEAGRQVYENADAMCRNAGAALNVGATGRPVRGKLRVSAPVEIARSWLPPLLSEFRRRWPDVALSIEASDATRGASDGIDLVIRATFQLDVGSALKLSPRPCELLPIDLVCAPGLVTSGTAGKRLAASGYVTASDEGTDVTIPARDASGRKVDLSAPVTATADDRLTTHALALQGLGAARLLRGTVDADIDAGRLARLLPDFDFGIVALRLMPTDPQPASPVLAFVSLAEELTAPSAIPCRNP